MEVGTEISQKIRSAIKAKLMELGAYVDDELPDYIMVMVANKKNKSQMKADLSLFLGTNTDTFTSWLHGLLGKLQTITVESGKDKGDKTKSSKEKKKDKTNTGGQKTKSDLAKTKKSGKDKNRKRKSSCDIVEDAPKAKVAVSKTGEENESIEINEPRANISNDPLTSVSEDTNEKHTRQALPEVERTQVTESEETNNISEVNRAPSQEDFEDVRQLLVAVTPVDDLARELDAAEEEAPVVKKSSGSSQATSVSSKVAQNKSAASSGTSHHEQKVKRKVPSSVVASVNREEDDEEYDPFNPAVGSVASVVKVTSRKSSFPPAMQANRALLVKAMSEAEKSIATKRKVAVTRPMNQQPSPAEYSPKRNRSLAQRETASPPPYIPSRKDGGGRSQSSVGQKALSQDDIRHTLGREDSRGLTSASRREEILRKVGTVRSHTVASKSRTSSASVQSPSSSRAGSNTDAVNCAAGSSYGREVKRFDRKAGGVKNFQITARVGPLRSGPSKESSAKPGAPDIPESDRALRFTVISDESRESSAEPQTRVKTVVRKAQSSERNSTTNVRDAREDIQKFRQGKSSVVEDKSRGIGARVISKLARDAVQKQCKAAVRSVTSASAVKRHSPDSRVVQYDSKSPSVESQHSEDIDTLDVRCDDGSGSEVSSNKVLIRRSPKLPLSVGKTSPKISQSNSVKDDVDEIEDLSQMLEDEEDLESQLMLEEQEKNEFTLDLDDEELSHVVEEVAAEAGEPEMEKDDSKSGIRFIVTLDGVDVAQYDDVTSRSHSNVVSPEASRPVGLNPSSGYSQSVSPLPPSTAVRPMPITAQSQLASTQAQAAAKIRPPKIQPFSISLRDSDDEHEEKVVTYIQASDVTAVSNVSGSENGGELSALERARSQERCRYWPACMVGSACQYHHPTTHCKTFPNCKFGDKCLFIHPNCRFDSKCTRPDCPFTHTSKRHLSQLVASPMPPPRLYPRYSSVAQPQQNVTCHYFPNCLNPTCPFVHPKPCMFGAACKNSVCHFYHPVAVSPPVVTSTVPDKGKLKWQAQPSVQSKLANVKPSPLPAVAVAARSSTVSSTSL